MTYKPKITGEERNELRQVLATILSDLDAAEVEIQRLQALVQLFNERDVVLRCSDCGKDGLYKIKFQTRLERLPN